MVRAMKDDLISRSALTERIVDLLVFEWGYEGIEESVRQIFSEIPAVDAVEVVRCKECKHSGLPYICPMCFEETVYHNEGNYPDGSVCRDAYKQMFDGTAYDGFCDHGERRADDATD